MNKPLRFWFLTCLTAILFASCDKDTDFELPESFQRNNNPFSIEKVPVEGGSITLDRITKVGEAYHSERLSPELASLNFSENDSLVLTATPKNGYTFINWVRNGYALSNTQPIYGFRLKKEDIDEKGHVKQHYEARFGLDYALQVIPSIDQVMPADLIAEMGPYLYFGDNPPRIDSFSFDVLQILHFIHNSDHPEIPFDTNTMYYRRDGEYYPNKFNFEFFGQHRGVFDSCRFVRSYGELHNDGTTSYCLYEHASAHDSIFIMGKGDNFTIYYRQAMKRKIEPYTSIIPLVGGQSLTRVESVIISGHVSNHVVQHFHWGFRIEQYSEDLPAVIGKRNGLPAIHDIFHFKEYQQP